MMTNEEANACYKAFERIPEDDYHSASRRGEYLSSHLLADFRTSPILYHKKMRGLIEEKPKSAYFLGSAAHKIILEGADAYMSTYTISDGPINPKTGAPFGKLTKAYTEWLSEQKTQVVSTEDHALIQQMRAAVQSHRVASGLLDDGIAEGVIRVGYEGRPCQARLDWFCSKGIVDLKTTQDLDSFEYDARRYGYLFQLAFYRALLREKTGVLAPVFIIAVEKCEPFRAGVWQISPNVLDEAEAVNKAALARLCKCIDADTWPTMFENLHFFTSLY